jgi:16S rRNA (guanine(966)-N(2))-methyltransferase RsmD
LRIVSGSHKGRRFYPPKNLPVRPTTDFAKEGLFNVLNNQIDLNETSILDLCAGTGNMTFEFASRGAKKVIAVDQHRGCIGYIKKISAELELKCITAVKSDLYKFLERSTEKHDLIFADPPYGMAGSKDLPKLIFEKQLLKENGLFILEHSKDLNFEGQAHFLFSRKYGNVNFTFFQEIVA